ncbi:MAG: M20 family metallopeptidase [SAR324 cluster bacterium]|nr:M20 family metallopeptidase [SAR324 cluster bacterium]
MKNQLIPLSQKLISFDTINPPGNELEAMEYLEDYLKSEGFTTSLHIFEAGRANLVATVRSKKNNPPLCFTGHLDVVPLGKAIWSKKPFGGEVAEGKIYGRGSSDMKCGVASIVASAIEAHRQKPDELDLCLILTAGEERGYEGAKALVRDKIITAPIEALIVAEPTSNIPWFGHKGCLWFKASATGVAAHGSTPELGENAIYKAVAAIEKLKNYDFKIPVHPLHGKPTLSIGTITGGSNINSVPDFAEFTIDIRTLPNQDSKKLTEDLGKELEGLVTLCELSDGGAIATDPSIPWMKMCLTTIREVLPRVEKFEFGNYVTDAGILTPSFDSPPTVILGPGEASQAHKRDEYCFVEKLDQSFDLFLKIMLH